MKFQVSKRNIKTHEKKNEIIILHNFVWEGGGVVISPNFKVESILKFFYNF